MRECWFLKRTSRMPSFFTEVISDLVDQRDFISRMIGAMNDQSSWFIIDDDVFIFVEDSLNIELALVVFGRKYFSGPPPYLFTISREKNIDHIACIDTIILFFPLSIHSYVFFPQCSVDVSEFCSRKNLSEISV